MKLRHLICAIILALYLPAVSHSQEVKLTVTAHSATLNWTQSPAPSGTCGSSAGAPAATVTANGVYRSTSSGTETLLATVSPAATSYVDPTVIAGVTYYFKISAVSCGGTVGMPGTGSESALSNEVSATIPNPAGAPTPPVLNSVTPQ